VKDRKTLLEIRVAMATLDALKRQYGFKRFHLVGQSGGGHTVAGLVQLRSDIGCAVIASGPISLRSMMRDKGHPIVGKHPFYDPIDHVNTMRQRPGLRLFVVSDPNDKLVSYRSQLEFVVRAKAHNLPITHVTATATDKNSHGLFAYGHQLADNCAHDAWEAEEVERAWAVTKDTTTIAVLEEFVRNYGDSHYAALARARMEEFRKSQAAAQTTVPPGFDAVPRPPGANGENITLLPKGTASTDAHTGAPCFGSEDCKDYQRQYCFGPEDCKNHPDYSAFDTPTNAASTKRPASQQQPPCFGPEDCKSHPDYSAFGTPETPRVTLPPLIQNASPPSVASVAPSAPMPPAAANGTMQPRRIPTIPIKGDPAS
jgi:pimeloyl-ACP methyl ester carboxylesterase